jgi:Family of unknown function (DUF6959)
VPVKPLEVYSDASNYGVVRMPGQNYPACGIPGDPLAILCRTARRVVDAILARDIDDYDLLGDLVLQR